MKRKQLPGLLALALVLALVCGVLPMTAGASESPLVTIVEPTFTSALPFSEGMAAVCYDDYKWGFINDAGEMVIEPKYDFALSFQDGVAVVAYNDGSLGDNYAAVYLLKPDGTEIPLYKTGTYYMPVGKSMLWDESGKAPLTVRVEPGAFDGFINGCSGGVVTVLGTAYTKSGTEILPKSYAGFAEQYQSYQALGPAVDGIIPCKALFYSRSAWGQCFYMDASGTVLHKFPSGDDDNASIPQSYIYAPDPETGRIIAQDLLDKESGASRYGMLEGSTDLRNHLNDSKTWESKMLSVNPGFLNIRLTTKGSIFVKGYATVLLDSDKEGQTHCALLPPEMGRNYFMTRRDPNQTDFDGWTTEERTFEMAGQFGQGDQDNYCPVQENGSWHYLGVDGYDYQVEGPNGGTANLGVAGTFVDGYAPVYDRDIGKTYLISAVPMNGVLPMVPGTDQLALKVYFPDYYPDVDEGYGATRDISDILAIQGADGKIGFAKMAQENEDTPDTPSVPSATGFTDVKAGAFYSDAVNWAVGKGVTNGTSETTFGPDDPCTRGHIVTFLWRAKGSPEPKTTDCPFVDVKPNGFYYKAMLWAVENEITKGIDATHFAPDEPCNRAQAVTFLWRAENQPAPKNTATVFTDVNPKGFYYNAMLWAGEQNITKGATATTFEPETTCTRGHIVTFLYRDLAG